MSSRTLVVYTGPQDASATAAETLGPDFAVRRVEPIPSDVAASLTEADALIDASMKVQITREMIEASPKLRIIATATTGANHIDQEALLERGIPLLTLRGQTELLRQLTPAAEHSWLLLMACARRLTAASQHVLDGGWDRTLFPGLMLRGRTLGLIGCGRIGQRMAQYASAFEMKVLGFDPVISPWPAQITRCSLDDLLTSVDIVSIHVPLTSETRHLLSAAEFNRLKPGALLVNTSRGEVLDESALADAIRSGRVAGAAVDVLAGEPEIAESELLALARVNENVIITPHIGGFAPDAVRMAVRFTASRIRAALLQDS